MALAVFVWPLLDAHRILVADKDRRLEDSATRFESALDDLHQRLDEGRLEGMDDLHKAIASLEMEREALDGIPTWPWPPETMRLLITALAMPLALWIVQYVLQRLLAASAG